MDLHPEISLAGRTVLAAFLGACIGWERRREGRSAGIRTYSAVSLGSCAFGVISSQLGQGGSSDRIAAQVVSGIGFLGAGVIMRDKGQVRGLATAATLWATAAVGMAVAYDMFVLASLTAAIIFLLLWMHRLPGWHWLVGHGVDSDGKKPASDGPQDTGNLSISG
ncbi:MAG: MgtC/SapB family protein [Gemmataceae bacterium]|nr:MgtC/SapB family protein [Gemmataceae bacterium]